MSLYVDEKDLDGHSVRLVLKEKDITAVISFSLRTSLTLCPSRSFSSTYKDIVDLLFGTDAII